MLSAALGAYPHTEALKKGRVDSDLLKLEFVEISPINRAFAPMARERRFDVSEMAIATFLQAKAYGVRLTLLPIAVAARFQESALLTLVDSAVRSPGDLAGRRVGVRAYSQTTGLWLRGVLADDFGVMPSDIRWVTFEGAHVAEYADPDFVKRAAPGKDMLAMLRAGDLDAVIVGNDVPDDSAFRTVFPNPSAAADAFWAKRGFVPINHMIVVRSEIAEEQPEIARELCRMFAAAKAAGPASSGGRDRAPIGRAAVEPSVVFAMRYAVGQGLLPRALAIEEIWRNSPTSELQHDWSDNASGQVRRGGE